MDYPSVQALRPDAGRIVAALAEALGCKRRKQTPVHGQTWRIGALEAEAGEVMFYFHTKLQSEEDARSFSDALSREVRTQWRLAVTAAGTLPVAGSQAVRLDDLAELDHETGALRILATPADFVGMPRRNPGGRPSEQGPALAAIMSDRQDSGVALAGLNAESREIRAAFTVQNPSAKTPSIETVKRHLSKFRAGS
ncbi:hypothetical protein [Cognatishimia sp. F0-27]|uniref:hypothetical protein n=1 Tax=Cognatishimia sp. F0-27 TaxID=2816855 RepID=UPI001D0C8ACB|nr:hypothetical protein [Cognatishimia sp. F0-27]MCC1495083.1 hypothetical protein [Cognatishimia sp. F0-27]